MRSDDQAKIAAQFGGTEPPEFLTPGINAYYSLPAGASSCYGDQVMCALESLTHASSGPGLDAADLAARMCECFSEDSHYGTLNAHAGLLPDDLPVPRGYRHGSITGMLRLHLDGYDCGTS